MANIQARKRTTELEGCMGEKHRAECFRANWKRDNSGVSEITLLLGLEVQIQVQEPV